LWPGRDSVEESRRGRLDSSLGGPAPVRRAEAGERVAKRRGLPGNRPWGDRRHPGPHGARRPRAGGGGTFTRLPRDPWHAFLPGAHEGYIPWAAYEDNQRRLAESAQAHGTDRRAGPPREGPALLQGLAVCGRCGRRMTVTYHARGGRLTPDYVCERDAIEHARAPCQRIPGAAIDQAIGELLVQRVTPLALDVALEVQQELTEQAEAVDRLRAQHVERARYEADLAQTRYLRVDPHNRLVADVLEGEWNARLRDLHQAQEDSERQRQADRMKTSPQERSRILALATDFPRLWRAPGTSDRDRKRIVRLLLDDVTLLKNEAITAGVRFRGGATTTLALPRPPSSTELWTTPREVVAEIDRLLDRHTEGEIADLLNGRGLRSGRGLRFHRNLVGRIRRAYGLKSRYDRLREAGLLTAAETAQRLHLSPSAVNSRRRSGSLPAHRYNDKPEHLFDPPGSDTPGRSQGRRLLDPHRPAQLRSHPSNEVQYEA